jgi:Fe-S cluster biogenesis protein NfuA
MALENGSIDAPTGEQVRTLVEKLSAYIEQFHGGSVEMVSFDGKVLTVRLGGACLGCLCTQHLHGWVEGTIKRFSRSAGQVGEL